MLEWSDFVQQYDVVITTYQVLRSDFNVARAPPVRPRREDVKYVNIERPRSPLVMVEWNRVIMDEVQMVGGAKLEYVTRPVLEKVTHSNGPYLLPIGIWSRSFHDSRRMRYPEPPLVHKWPI